MNISIYRQSKKLFTILCIAGLQSISVKGDLLLEAHGDEVKALYRTSYLEELGLTRQNLNWGNSISGAKIAATLIQPKDKTGQDIGQTTLALSISNEGAQPLIVPILNFLPEIKIYQSKDYPSKLLKRTSPLIQAGGEDRLKLEPGKTITFIFYYRFLTFNKDKVPMTITVNIENSGLYAPPGGGSKLESAEFDLLK